MQQLFESTKILNQGGVRKPISFVEAVFRGLAPDGGLYFPIEYANLASLMQSFSADVSFVDMAISLTTALFADEFSASQVEQLCTKAFSFRPKLQALENNITLLELFHGPSCAFKDFGASYLAGIMEQELANRNKAITILTATSGDTGSAVAQAFHNKQHIKVVILYPSGRVSPLQEKQLTSVGDNIYAIEVQGSFDDCQRMVKESFTNSELRTRFGLSSANSINIGRLVPQSFYYIYAWNQLRHQGRKDWVFCTPSGNFGNLTAGLLAKHWGLPLQHIIAACNANDIVPKYLQDGQYEPKDSLATLANAMDVGRPSNFERMHTMYLQQARADEQHKDGPVTDGNGLGVFEPAQNTSLLTADLARGRHDLAPKYAQAIHHKMASEISSQSVSDEEISAEISRVHTNAGQLICPHTAVGVKVSRNLLESAWAKEHAYAHAVVLSTAHAGKFFEVIENICGIQPELPPRLASFLQKESFAHSCQPNLDNLVSLLDGICR